MAVFGFQLCFTLIMASFLQKLSPIYSFGRWLLCNGSLVRYKHPTDAQLKKLCGKRNEKVKSRSKKNGDVNVCEESKTFKVPKSLDIVLEVEKIGPVDAAILRNYADYEWMVNYTLFAVLVYLGTEIYYEVWKPTNDFNIAMVWIALSFWFAVRSLLAVLLLYAKSKAGGEISTSVAFAMFSFISSLAVLMANNNFFDYKFLESPVGNRTVVSRQVFDISRLQLFLATVSAGIGLLFIFPAMRMAQMYMAAIKWNQESHIQFALHANFFAPALISLMWIKPLLEVIRRNPQSGEELIELEQIAVLRIALVVVFCLLRLSLMRVHLQAYLNLAHEKLIKLKKESGTIINTDLQRLISQVYYYLGVVAVQYVSPIVITLCAACCLKTIGGYSWLAIRHPGFHTPDAATSSRSLFAGDQMIRDIIDGISVTVQEFRAGFSETLIRGAFSYLMLWCTANWFTASCIGYFYYFYLSS